MPVPTIISAESSNRPQRCDLIVHNATILTVDADDRVVANGAFAVRNGRIVALASKERIFGDYTSDVLFDAEGGIVHPGFIDAHVHISQYTSHSVLPLMEGTSVTMGHWKGELTAVASYRSGEVATFRLRLKQSRHKLSGKIRLKPYKGDRSLVHCFPKGKVMAGEQMSLL